ncbi:transcriptional regulator [Clostridia bacterium]|nr:transcriptional regulator [Clostridia bacterium]
MRQNDTDRCDCNIIHEEVVAEVRLLMPDDDKLSDLADLFKVFSDPSRVKILCALLHAEMCVCDLAGLLGMSKSAVSHQLKQLRMSRLVKPRRDGVVMFYSLDDEHVGNVFEQGMLHVMEE